MSAARLISFPARARARRAEEATGGELCVVLACHQLVCAIPVRRVERLVQPDEVATVAGSGLVLVGEREYAAWNLGAMLGLAPLGAAWILMRVPHHGRELPFALHTGRCLVVQQLAPGVPLPPCAFRSRGGAIASAFPTTRVRSAVGQAQVGLWLDPDRLWSGAELDASAAELGRTGSLSA